MHQTNLDNSYTVEVSMNDVTIHISNDADPVLPVSPPDPGDLMLVYACF